MLQRTDSVVNSLVTRLATILQVFLKGKARRNPDAVDSRGKKAKAVADFLMEGNRTVTYGKISHQARMQSVPVILCVVTHASVPKL